MRAGSLMPDIRPQAGGRGPFIDIELERHVVVLKVLDAGWQRASKSSEVHPGAGEVAMTEHLRVGMREALKEQFPRWRKMMTVLPGTESHSAGARISRPDGLTDLPIFFQDIREKYHAHDPHAIVECKRISGSDPELCRLYVDEGVDRFRSGKYAAAHTTGFMTGYLLSGDAASATVGINRQLPRKARGAEHLGSSTILSDPWARTSRHPRPGLSTPIDLHHAFFGF